jgi:hypothetical protein
MDDVDVELMESPFLLTSVASQSSL